MHGIRAYRQEKGNHIGAPEEDPKQIRDRAGEAGQLQRIRSGFYERVTRQATSRSTGKQIRTADRLRGTS